MHLVGMEKPEAAAILDKVCLEVAARADTMLGLQNKNIKSFCQSHTSLVIDSGERVGRKYMGASPSNRREEKHEQDECRKVGKGKNASFQAH